MFIVSEGGEGWFFGRPLRIPFGLGLLLLRLSSCGGRYFGILGWGRLWSCLEGDRLCLTVSAGDLALPSLKIPLGFVLLIDGESSSNYAKGIWLFGP